MKTESGAKCLWGILVGVVLLGFGTNMLPVDMAVTMSMEHGHIEMVTEWGLLVVVCLLLIATVHNRIPHGPLAAILTFLLYLRELDFNSRFTNRGVFKTRFYISPEVPIGEKLIVSIIMIMLLLVIGRYLFFNLRSFIKALLAGKLYACAIALAIGMAIMSKALQSLKPLLLKPVSFLYSNPFIVLEVWEEVFELSIPLFLASSLFYYLFPTEGINTK